MPEQLANIDAVFLKFRRLLGTLLFSLPLLIGSFVFFLPLLTSYLIWGSHLVQSHRPSRDAYSARPDTQESEIEERYRRRGVSPPDFNGTQAAQATQEPIFTSHNGYSEPRFSATEADHERGYREEQERLRSEEQRRRFDQEDPDSEEEYEEWLRDCER